MSSFPIAFGRHLLLERINAGGMAEVFKAKSFGVEGFERIVAVKRILPSLAEDEEFTTMFVDEARIAAHLSHQNIVQIYELGKYGDDFFIAMEYVAGKDLRDILDDQKANGAPLEVPKACFIVCRVAEALEYAHRKRDPAGNDLKIIHRDVTPQNVIISYEGEVKLCDFGIAKAATRASKTQVGVLKGKFAYLSPEQVRGVETDRRSDLFALGVIFYEMVTGNRLFLGETDYQTLDNVRSARIPPPSERNPRITPALERVMLKLLAREPRDRYQWASELHEDLIDHLLFDGRPFQARHMRAWMQERYRAEVEIENTKLEEFMRLRMPEPSAVRDPDLEDPGPSPAVAVLARADSGVQDPARPEGTGADFSDETAFEGPPPSDTRGTLELETGDLQKMIQRAGSGRAEVGGSISAAEDEIDADRTEHGAPLDGPDGPEGSFDEHDDTVLATGGPKSGLSDAEAKLIIARLDAAAARLPEDSADTVDSSEVSKEVVRPGVTDPSEVSEVDAGGPFLSREEGTLAAPRSAAVAPNDDAGWRDFEGPRLKNAWGIDGASLPRSASPRERDVVEEPLAGAKKKRRPAETRNHLFGRLLGMARTLSRRGALGRPNVLISALIGAAAVFTAIVGALLIGTGSRSASLVIRTEPTAEVHVELDGVLVGSRTPLSLDDVALGEHELALSAPGYRRTRQTIRIVSAKPHTVVLPLERDWVSAPDPVPGHDPAKEARAESEARAIEATAIRRPPGEAREEQRRTKPTKPAKPKGRRSSGRATGSLMVSTTPPGVAVWINGAPTGLRTPIRKPYKLPAGTHQVTFVMSDGRKYSFDVNISPGGLTKLTKPLR